MSQPNLTVLYAAFWRSRSDDVYDYLCEKIKITKPLRRPARVWDPIVKQISIEKLAGGLNKCRGCRVPGCRFISLGPGQSSPAILLSPNSFDS